MASRWTSCLPEVRLTFSLLLPLALLVWPADAQTQLNETDDLEVQLRLVDARFKAGQTEAALQQIHTLQTRFAANNPALLPKLARLLDQNGRSEEALELYRYALDQMQHAVRADPRNEDRYLDLAGFLESQHATDA